MKRALILVDLQNDFIPGGALPVPQGDQIIPLINDLQKQFDLIVATQDWHPADHGSFAANHPGRKVYDVIDLAGLPQVLWPVHCVQGTRGAELVASLDTSRITKIFQKGTDPAIDSYSGFFDNGHKKATGLGEFLAGHNVTDVYIVGLATDYCVKFTALDAQQLGFNTHLIEDACRGVNVKAGDVDRALADMQAAGVIRGTSQIRANQGHSVAVELGYAPTEPPDVLFHGTASQFLPSIYKNGLTKGKRHDVHLSESPGTAQTVGARRGKPITLKIRAGQMHRDGLVFRLSENRVWLTDHVPPQYIQRQGEDV